MRVHYGINARRGTVVSVSKNKTEITIQMDKGGRVKARNEGFRIGDKVCFLLSAAKKKIIRVMSALTADVAVTVGSDHILQSALQEEPHDLETNFNEFTSEDEPIIWEDEEIERDRETSRNTDEEQTTVKFDIDDGS